MHFAKFIIENGGIVFSHDYCMLAVRQITCRKRSHQIKFILIGGLKSGSETSGGSYRTATTQIERLASIGKVLVAAGYYQGPGSLKFDAELYDPASGTWTATGNMIEARARHTATLLPDGRVLVVPKFQAHLSAFS